MKQMRIPVQNAVYENLKILVDELNRSPLVQDGGVRKVSVTSLMAMLAEDAAYVVTRPGSWEGSSMAELLQRHGYL